MPRARDLAPRPPPVWSIHAETLAVSVRVTSVRSNCTGER
jgi:hypothetical protein